MNDEGKLFATMPPDTSDTTGYTLGFDLLTLDYEQTIDDKPLCGVAGGARHSEKYIPDYADLKAEITFSGGGA